MELTGRIEIIDDYLGIHLNPSIDFLSKVLKIMSRLTPDFVDWMKNQQHRDHGRYHVTMIPSFEYEVLSTDQTVLLPIGKDVSVHIKGFGQIRKDHAVTVYAVVEAPLINQCRSRIGLPDIYPHITIGFNPHDIHGVKKDASTIFAR